MTAKIIDGKAFAADVRERAGAATAILRDNPGLKPGLAVVLVGEDPASQVYVRNKAKQTTELGMTSVKHELPTETPQADIIALVQSLNDDPAIHGILVQMPLPDHMNEAEVVNTIDPDKDVDGLTAISAGRLVLGQDGLVPCTPSGILLLTKHTLGNLSGLNALVIGRSILVGKPIAQLLLAENCTVTMAHSRTKDLPGLCRQADILVAAVGRERMVKGDWIKPGATIMDVGINRIPAPERGAGKTRLVGDVDFDEAKEVAGAITPVPGGIGPMTIACLLRNTVIAACRQAGVSVPQELDG